MVPSPSKGSNLNPASGPLNLARNRPIIETPVVISDGSGSDAADPPRPSKTSASTDAVMKGSVPKSTAVPSERVPALELN